MADVGSGAGDGRKGATEKSTMDGSDKTIPEVSPKPAQQDPQQFDFLNWYYWSLWWQQYSYWLWHLQSSTHFPQGGPTVQPGNSVGGSGVNDTPGSGSGSHDQQLPDYQQQWMQHQNQYPGVPMYPIPHGQPVQPQGGDGQGAGYVAPQPMQQQQGFFLRVRVITGFEVFVAPVWKRMLAEMVDMLLFALILKVYLPEIDYRIPEVVFEGAEVWIDVDEEDLMDIRDTLTTFLFSVVMERLLHSLMETLWIAVFSCTPGKWLMGLRVLRCSTVSYTRTAPRHSVKIEPGRRLPFFLALFRALFKSIVSLFCPLIVFFFILNKGRTRYDEVMQSAVVDVRSLYRPIFSTRRPQLQIG